MSFSTAQNNSDCSHCCSQLRLNHASFENDRSTPAFVTGKVSKI